MHPKKRLKKFIVRALILFFTVSGLFLRDSSRSFAYSSWVQNSDAYEELYGEGNLLSSDETDSLETESEEPKESFVSQQLGAVVYGLGYWINKLSTGGKVNLSIDGIVFGRLNQSSGVNYFGFDLSPGNPYGVVGATVYTIFRGLCYSGLFIFFLILLAKSLFSTGAKAREEFKSGIYAILIAFALMYLMPQIVDMGVFIRDSLVIRVARSISKGSISVAGALSDLYENGDNDLISAICYTALSGACLFYARDYVSIALQQTVLFGLFPVFNLLGADKKKFLSDWCMTFFSNMLVPLIDAVMLIMPYTVIKNLSGDGDKTITFVEGAIIVLMIWGSRTARSQTLKLFGNATGSPAGRGLMGLAQMAQMARMSARMGRNIAASAIGSASVSDSYSGWKDEEIGSSVSADNMNKEAAGVAGSISDLDMDLDHIRKGEAEEIAKGGTGFGEGAINDEFSLPGAEDAGGASLPDMTGGESVDMPDNQSFISFDEARLKNLESMDRSSREIDELARNSEEINSQILEEREKAFTGSGVSERGPVRAIEDLEKENARIDKDLEQGRLNKAKSDNLDKIEYNSYKKDGNKEGCLSVRQRMAERQDRFDESQAQLKMQKARNLEDIKASRENASAVSEERINALKARKDSLDTRSRALQEEINKRKSAERHYAQIASSHGMGDKQFNNAQEMRINRLIMDNRVKALKEKSVVSRDDLKGLSPEARSEIARIQKENIRRRNAIKAAVKGSASVLGAAAATTGAITGAVLGAYGGEDASMQGAMLGYFGTTAAGNRAMRAARFIYSNKEEIKDNAFLAVNTAKDAAKKAASKVNKKNGGGK